MAARCAVGEESVGIAFRADLAIDDALGAHAGIDKIAGHSIGEAHIAFSRNNWSCEFGGKLLGNFDADFEAFAANMRSDIGVELNGVFACLRGKLKRGFRRDMRNRPSPSGMHDGELAAWRSDDQRQAIGIVEQCRSIRSADDERISSFGSSALRLIDTPLLDAHDVRSMHLVGDDKLRIGRAERLEHDLAIPKNRPFIIFNMQIAVQGRIWTLAHPTCTAGESNAHACLRKQLLIGKDLQSAMRPQRERIELRQGKLRTASHGAYTRRRRNSGM